MLRNKTEAEDAAQEVFIKAYKSLSTFKSQSSFYTWLHSIAAHHCLDLLRKPSRKQESLDALLEKEGPLSEKSIDSGEQLESSLGNADLVNRLLSQLPEETRALLLLREVQGLSYLEISSVLNCSLEAVRARLYRARLDVQKIAQHFLKSKNV